jgi:GAF domain-containing protein
MNIDNDVLAGALGNLTGLPSGDVAVGEAVQRVVSATRSVFEVTGAGLMLVDASSVLRYVAASDEPGRLLERAQEQEGNGPCVESLILDEVVATDDLAADDRWPGVSEMVVPAGVRAVLGVPVHVAGGAVGSLNVYSDQPHVWDESERRAIHAFAQVIEDLLAVSVLMRQGDELVEQLQYALDHRVVVERAVGVVMATEGLDPVAAFDRLRRTARDRRARVAHVAEEVLRAGRLDP